MKTLNSAATENLQLILIASATDSCHWKGFHLYMHIFSPVTHILSGPRLHSGSINDCKKQHLGFCWELQWLRKKHNWKKIFFKHSLQGVNVPFNSRVLKASQCIQEEQQPATPQRSPPELPRKGGLSEEPSILESAHPAGDQASVLPHLCKDRSPDVSLSSPEYQHCRRD